MRERSDEALMKAFAGGSMQAFEHLYERHRPALYRYVLRKTGNPATANDLFQGAWEKVIRARAQYKPSVPFRAWLYRVTHNHVMDYFRRLQPATGISEETLESAEPGPDSLAALEARANRLRIAIGRLPGEQKDAMLLKLEGGLDVGEIATVTGVNRETAKSRLRYATGKLKEMLKGDSTDFPDDF
jgi:RNA polymerase sigma-70 factor (ECF subfamily)